MTIIEITEKKREALHKGNLNEFLYYDGMLDGIAEYLQEQAIEQAKNAKENEAPQSKQEYINKPKETNLSLADMCYTVRKSMKLSQKDFGKKFGISQSNISHIEQGFDTSMKTERKIKELYEEEFNGKLQF